MAISSTPTATCAYCEGERDMQNSVEGSFCSSECYYSHQGLKALRTVYNNHQHCSTCGRRRAEIELPKSDENFAIDESYDAAFNVVDGVVTYENYGQVESAKSAIGFRHPTINEQEGVCSCGTIERHGDGHYDVLKGVEGDAVLLRLRDRIKEAAIDGQRETWPSKGELLRVYTETGDLEYAVGVSL